MAASMAANGWRSPPIDVTLYLIEKDGVSAGSAAQTFCICFGSAVTSRELLFFKGIDFGFEEGRGARV